MSSKFTLGRRSLLQAMGVGAGAMVGTRLAGRSLIGSAHAQAAEKSAVLVVHTSGGYNALFPSAGSFLSDGTFGVNNGNIQDLGNGLVVDRLLAGTDGGQLLPNAIMSKNMASVGLFHRSSDHGTAQSLGLSKPNMNYLLQLAASMGGPGTILAARVGRQGLPGNNVPQQTAGLSFQPILDMTTTISALAGGDGVDRNVAKNMLQQAQAMSANRTAASPNSLTTVNDGYTTILKTLSEKSPVDFRAIPGAYGANTQVNDFRSQMAAAELMIRAGTNVVFARNDGWDSHGDRDGNNVRGRMQRDILPSLGTFIRRMNDPAMSPNMNVIVVILGDFSRSLPGSDHANGTVCTVVGKYIKTGSSFGTVNNRVQFDPNAPGGEGFWSLVARAAKVSTNPFGANPHTSVLAV